MTNVQCYSLVDLSNRGNFNTLKQTMELRTQITITGGPKKMQDQDMASYEFGSDHSNTRNDSTRRLQTVWKLEFEYEQEDVFGPRFEALIKDLDFIPIEYELQDTAIFKVPTFITKDHKQRNVYFQHI